MEMRSSDHASQAEGTQQSQSLSSLDDYTYAYALLSLGSSTTDPSSSSAVLSPTCVPSQVTYSSSDATAVRMFGPTRENSGKSLSDASFSSQASYDTQSLCTSPLTLSDGHPGKKRVLHDLNTTSTDSADAVMVRLLTFN